ncbi:cell division protein FtsZ [Inquilinus sp. 2KB_12]|uniref:Cell division protein FtsZ n=1 Tax=Inquilinus ginsengisoli TaxID=363840 RepID=A0ABU1JHB3_9PROT|nr:cell division protein FtsZ [Inquilinus ginsengisoli]MDR6288009.1 cell division protein FtsZ [Inquilinus ginsengisoli]
MINLSIPQGDVSLQPRITVVGVGGAGGNAVNNMIRANLAGVEFVVANTDAQALAGSASEKRIQLGAGLTQGLGAGSRPDIGRASAEEAMELIVAHLEGAHMVFITAGMGGGTGTGAAPVIARAAREQGILTVGVVTKPFHFEGAHRMRMAEQGLQELQQYVDTLIIIPNQNLFRIANEKTTFADAFKMADEVLHSGVRGVTDLMVQPGLINLDFADIRTVMAEMGKAMMGTGEAEGERRSISAAEAAISNPLLDDISMKGAKGVLINITGGLDMTLYEVDEATNRIRDEVDPDANIIFGSTFDETMEGRVRVSVVATGIDMAINSQGAGAARPQTYGTTSLPSGDRARQQPAPAQQPTAPARPAPVMPQRFVAPKPAAAPVVEQPAAAAPVESAPEEEYEHQAEIEAEAEIEAPEPVAVSQQVAARAPGMMGGARAGLVAPRPAMASAARPAAAPQPVPEPQPVAAPDAGRKRLGLFRRVTGLLREEEPAPELHHAQPTLRQEPATRVDPPRAPAPVAEAPRPVAQQRLAIDAGRAPLPRSDEDALDIPAFLRRQAN